MRARKRPRRSLESTVVWRGPLREDDRDSQVAEVENAIARGVAGIALAPLDESALVGPVTSAMQREDPGRHLRLGPEGRRLRELRSHRQRRRRTARGRAPGETVSGKGRVVMLRYAEGHDSTTQARGRIPRARFRQSPGLQLVSANQYGGADVEGAYKRGGSAAQQSEDARWAAGRRRHLLPERVGHVRDDARAAGQRLGGARSRFIGFDASDEPRQGAARRPASMAWSFRIP